MTETAIGTIENRASVTQTHFVADSGGVVTVTAERAHDMTGASTHKTLVARDANGAQVDRSEGITKVADELGRPVTVRDQRGRVKGTIAIPSMGLSVVSLTMLRKRSP